jgi:hypothetical protein
MNFNYFEDISTKIHLRIEQRNLWNFPAKSSQRGWAKYHTKKILTQMFLSSQFADIHNLISTYFIQNIFISYLSNYQVSMILMFSVGKYVGGSLFLG